MNTVIVVASLVSALGGIAGGVSVYQMRAQKRQINAQAKKLEVEPEVLLSQQAMDMFDRVVKQLRTEEAKSARLEAHVRELEDVLRKHGITPPPWPPLKVVDDDTA